MTSCLRAWRSFPLRNPIRSSSSKTVAVNAPRFWANRNRLRGSGYSNIRTLAGHWREWQAAGLPTE